MSGHLHFCRVCNGKNFESAIDLGAQPWGNNFLRRDQLGKETKYPLHVVWCSHCKTAQLDYTVPKEVMFSDHTYLSGTTSSLSSHLERIEAMVNSRYAKDQPEKWVLDIGSNDGTLLSHFKNLGWEVFGVESSRSTAELAVSKGIKTLNSFYNLETQKLICRKFDIINASGVFFHLEELHSVTEAIKIALKPQGVFIVQFLYMKRIMENNAFDQIYHEHLLYYTLHSLRFLLAKYNLDIFDAAIDPIHGGSMVAHVGHRGAFTERPRLTALLAEEEASGCNDLRAYKALATSMVELKCRELDLLAGWNAKGKRIFGMGAPVKGNTLLNYLGVDTGYIEVLVERNALRRGLFAPGSHIPVVIEDEFTEIPDVYYVLAWNYKDEILARYESLIRRPTHFHFPVNPGNEE